MLRRTLPWLVLGVFLGSCADSIEIDAPTAIAVSNTEVSIAAPIGAPPGTATVRIVNGTEGTLKGLTVTVEDPAAAPWLTVALDRTTATQTDPATLTVQGSAENLLVGLYAAVVRLAAEGAGNGPIRIAVRLEVRPRPPAKLAIVTQPPAQQVNGLELPAAPAIQLLNALDEPTPVPGIAVTAAVAGGGTLSGTTTAVTDDNGRATFTGLTITGAAGSKTLVFSAPNIGSATSTEIALSAGPAKRLEAASALTQTADAGSPVPAAPKVQVVDVSGNPVAGFAVGFQASAGSTIQPGGTVTTAATGVAALTSWTLKPAAGANTVTASAAGLENSPITFTATGQVGAPAALVKQSGDNLIGIVGTTLGTPHVVKVTDAAGNGVGGVTVTWTAQGGGSVTPGTVTTDENGLAAASRTLSGAPGPATTTAAATIAGATRQVVFSVTGADAGPAKIVKVSGDGQTAVAGTTLPLPLQVRVLDAVDVPVAGATVTFTTPNAGGDFPSGASVETDGQGLATATWRLGTGLGQQTAEAATGGPAPAVFTATADPGPVSATLSTIGASPATMAAGGSTTLLVTARDAAGNPVQGATVVLAVTGSGTLTQPAGTTGSDGKASGGYTTTVSGGRVVSATVNGVALSQTVTLTVNPGPPVAVAAVSSTAITGARFGQAITPLPTVKVSDAFGNGVPGVAVTFAVTQGAATTTPAGSVTTNAIGRAAVSSWITSTLGSDYANGNVRNRLQASLALGAITGNPVTFTATVDVSYASDLVPFWSAYCTGCHNGGQAPNLSAPAATSYAELVANNGYYVFPGDSTRTASRNILLGKMLTSHHISYLTPQLATNLFDIIAAWAQQGAKQN